MSDNGMSAGPRPDDRVIVLFGATGDLARRKLLPGLFHLLRSRPAAARVPHRRIGAAVVRAKRDQFRAHARDAVEKFGITKPDDPSWPGFEQRLSFGMAKPGNSSELEAAVQRAEKEIGDPRGGCTTLPYRPPRSSR